jgi:hypothetical protein
MKVIVNGKFETLDLIDGNGVNWARDLIGNWNGLDAFTYNRDLDAYECDQETYNWWASLLAKHAELDRKVADLSEEFGAEAVQEVLESFETNDLEDLVNGQLAALEEAFAPVK